MDKQQWQVIWQIINQPPRRTFIISGIIVCIVWVSYLCWSPGRVVTDGRHDLKLNGIWLQQSWLGDDLWLNENRKRLTDYRNAKKIKKLAKQLKQHHITYVFPMLWPCKPTGNLPETNHKQILRFFNEFKEFKVVPCVGGILEKSCRLDSPVWRKNFIESIKKLLVTYPQFAGIQIKIDPLPTGTPDFILMLRELRRELPAGKIISVVAFPPPTQWHPYRELHWDQGYYNSVAKEADLIAVMFYGTSVKWSKLYQGIVAQWTVEAIQWSNNSNVLLGVPTHEDYGIKYHYSKTENLKNCLKGIHEGLSSFERLPENYQGIAVFSEWETDTQEWSYLKTHFCSSDQPQSP